MIVIFLSIVIAYLWLKVLDLSKEMSEYRTHGLNMYCDDPSAHYKITIGKKK